MTTYKNPILKGMYPDPSIVRVDDTYYLVNSTFEYYPGIAISKSTDLLNWEKLPSIAQLPEQADLRLANSNEGIFAVCVRYYQDHFYVITTNFSEFKTLIIRGTLTDNKQNIVWEEKRVTVDVYGIDPDLFFEDDHCFLQFTGYIDDKGTKAIQQLEIDPKTGNILRGPEVLTLGTGGRDVEGPHIIQKNDWYYLLMAEGGTGVGHFITMMRSKNIWGPFTEEKGINPLFTNRDRADEPLQNIGHADLFQDPAGNWWLTCLGTRPAQVGFTQITNLGRETLLYPVTWDQDWPIIYNGIPAQTVDLTDFINHQKTVINSQKNEDFIDCFSEANLHPEWVTLRNKLSDEQLKISKGHLSLTGNQQTLNDLSTPSFIGLRQTEHNESFSVTIDSTASNIGTGSFGIASLINVDHYAAIMIEKLESEFQVVRYQRVGDLEIKKVLGILKTLPYTFRLENSDSSKTFSVENTQTNEKISFTTDAIHFSNEAIAALNTGDFQGMYALNSAKMVITEVRRKMIK